MLILKKDTVFIEPNNEPNNEQNNNDFIKPNNNFGDLFDEDTIRKFVEQYIEEHKEELIEY